METIEGCTRRTKGKGGKVLTNLGTNELMKNQFQYFDVG